MQSDDVWEAFFICKVDKTMEFTEFWPTVSTPQQVYWTYNSRFFYITHVRIVRNGRYALGISNFRALARKLSFLPTELNIFDIRQHYVRILFIFQRPICWVLLFLTPTNMNLAVYEVMNHVYCVIKRDI